jgi:hypothetical protein
MTASTNKWLRQISFSAVLTLLSVGLPAQTSQDAPLPADFATAQTAFIGSAGAPALVPNEKPVVGIIYDSFYRQLNTWNRYKITASPKDADLAFEISMQTVADMSYMQLNIREVKTNVLLWTLHEHVAGAIREKTFQHRVDVCVGQLIEDLKLLAAGKQPVTSTSPAASKQP